MDPVKAEKLGTLFLAIFSTGLVAQLMSTGGLEPSQWAGAAVAALGSITAAVAVRVWPKSTPAKVRARD